MTDWEATRDRVQGFCSKFFSLIIGIFAALACCVYFIGVMRLITARQRFERLEVPHFLGVGFAIISTISYLVLHFIPRKAYRLMYFLTAMLMLSIIFVSHSMGVTGPTVDDCNDDLGETAGHIGDALSNIANATTTRRGSLGQSLGDCIDETIIFAASVCVIFFHIIAIFDVQRLLLVRVRAKTYGERFVEMGIR